LKFLSTFAIALWIISTAHANPLAALCERDVNELVDFYYSLRVLPANQRALAVSEQNAEMLKVRDEFVTDAISILAFHDVYMPHLNVMTKVLEDREYSYAELAPELRSDCLMRANRIMSIARQRRGSSWVPSLSSVIGGADRVPRIPTLITPFGNNWIDSSGVTYTRFQNTIRDSRGNQLSLVGQNWRSSNGQVYVPFGKGYVDATSGYSIRPFGNGYVDSNGNTAQPFGRGWVIR